MAQSRLDKWKAAKQHTITLPSDTQVDIVIPNLGQMIESDELPNHLVEAAVGFANATKITADMIRSQWEFAKFIVQRTVVDPALTDADIPTIPAEDVELLVQLATRERDVDAVGHHLAGLETNDQWRTFRGLDRDAAPVAGV